jgi:hypothetical protein
VEGSAAAKSKISSSKSDVQAALSLSVRCMFACSVLCLWRCLSVLANVELHGCSQSGNCSRYTYIAFRPLPRAAPYERCHTIQ